MEHIFHMDEKDRKIIGILFEDSSLSSRQISRKRPHHKSGVEL